MIKCGKGEDVGVDEKLNKNEIIEIVSEAAKVSKKDAKAVIDETFNLIAEALIKGEEVNIKNFGVFVPKKRKPRVGTHPGKHDLITIPETNTVFLRLAQSLKDKLNK